jgi:hypothetical protein
MLYRVARPAQGPGSVQTELAFLPTRGAADNLSYPCTVGGLSVVRFPATVTLSAVQISVTRPSQLVTHDFNDDTGTDTTSVCCMISAKPSYT